VLFAAPIECVVLLLMMLERSCGYSRIVNKALSFKEKDVVFRGRAFMCCLTTSSLRNLPLMSLRLWIFTEVRSLCRPWGRIYLVIGHSQAGSTQLFSVPGIITVFSSDMNSTNDGISVARCHCNLYYKLPQFYLSINFPPIVVAVLLTPRPLFLYN
jgi:hypothetical protein